MQSGKCRWRLQLCLGGQTRRRSVVVPGWVFEPDGGELEVLTGCEVDGELEGG